MFQWRVAATSPEVLNDTSVQTRRGRRRSTTAGHVDSLTGLRGFAALSVVMVHGAGLTDYPWAGLHAYGPIALFVLSGFLLIQPWSRWMMGAGEKPVIESFIRRRVWRIFPAYLVVLVVAALVLPTSRPLGADGWVRALTLTNSYGADGLRPGLEHTWSLGTELTWYAVVPLVALGVAKAVHTRFASTPVRPMLIALVVALAISVGYRYYVMFEVHDFGRLITMPLWLPAFIVCFMAGAAVAHMLIAHQQGKASIKGLRWFAARPGLVAAVAVGCALIGNSKLGGAWTFAPASFREISIRTTACTIIAISLLIGVAAGDEKSFLSRLFSARWLVATGRWSYGIYLWHMPAMLLLAREVTIQPGPIGLVIWMAILLAVSIPLGAATYAFVERPAIAWSKRGPQPRR